MRLNRIYLSWVLGGCLLPAAGCGGPAANGSGADDPAPGTAQPSDAADSPAAVQKSEDPATSENGLDAALAIARHSLATLEKIEDYTCVFSKRERVGDELQPEERDKLKIRHRPFSVYMRVIEPSSSAGQEVIFVKGRNDGNLIAHTTGFGSNVIGRVSLDPEGFIAKRGNRYTIKDVGLANLVKKLIDLGSKKELFRDSTVSIEKTEFSDRPCTQVEIRSPRPVGTFTLAIARIVVDDEMDVPVHFESHEWPAGESKAVLSETYSYYELKLNVGLTDRDFDPDNPEYSFP